MRFSRIHLKNGGLDQIIFRNTCQDDQGIIPDIGHDTGGSRIEKIGRTTGNLNLFDHLTDDRV